MWGDTRPSDGLYQSTEGQTTHYILILSLFALQLLRPWSKHLHPLGQSKLLFECVYS